MESIIQNKKRCLICGVEGVLHKHHIFMASNRRNSEKYGCWCWLCPPHHNMSSHGIHFDRELDLEVKKLAQHTFEEKYSRQEFMRIFGRNYLPEQEEQ